jgi:hypothetical protein
MNTQTATTELGMTWNTAENWVDAGHGQERLSDVDLAELRAEVENWRGAPIAGDREAESDWGAFCDSVREAQTTAASGTTRSPTRSPTMAANEIYHVAPADWDGTDLLPQNERYDHETDAGLVAYIRDVAARWPDLVAGYQVADQTDEAVLDLYLDGHLPQIEAYLADDGEQVHCHATLGEARAYAAEFGGQVLAIDAAGLDVEIGTEYDHPVVRGRIDAARISQISQIN